jgi:hypothetical protein
MFALIVGFSALLVAGCAAYFSVQGLASLYSGAFIAICIMAGSLEFGKLIAASYLHRFWNKTNFLLKTYLIFSIILLMGITSLGIFGFLTSAFQKSHVKVEIIETQRISLENNKNTILSEMNVLKDRIKTLNEIRLIQEQRVQDAGNYRVPREQAYEAIAKANQEIIDSQTKINLLSDKIKPVDLELLNLKAEETKSTDIGTLKFVSKLFNVETDIVVKWLTIIIVLVFDPLAICLVLAYNNIITNKNKKNIHEPTKAFIKVETPGNIKYQDK